MSGWCADKFFTLNHLSYIQLAQDESKRQYTQWRKHCLNSDLDDPWVSKYLFHATAGCGSVALTAILERSLGVKDK